MSSAEDTEPDEQLPEIHDIMLWSKNDMSDWLSKRGLPKSGRRKEVLAQRIYRHMTGEGSSSESESDGEDQAAGQDTLVRPKEDEWVDLSQHQQIPNIREEDITNYYLHGKNPVTGGHKNLQRYLKKSRKYSLESKYLETIQIYTDPAGGHTFIKTKARPSMKKGAYLVQVYLYKDTGMVREASCDCKVGAVGYCAHIGGLLFKLVTLRNPATSNLCSWVVPSVSRPIEPQLINDINWWPGKTNPAKPWPFTYKAGPCNEDAACFRDELLDGLAAVNPDCALNLHFRQSKIDVSPFVDSFATPCSIDDDVNLTEDWVQDLMRDYVEDLTIPIELSQLMERGTRGQTCNPMWQLARTFVLTSSNFGSIINMRPETRPDNILKMLCGYKTCPKTYQMKYGLKYEARARKMYMKRHQQSCGTGDKNVTVKSVGFVVSSKMPYLGTSLDGLVECPKCGSGALEIKCPWSFRNLHPKNIPGEKNAYITQAEDGSLRLKKNHRYWHQVQGQMAVTELTWADFVVFTQRDILVERIPFDADEWKKNSVVLKKFYQKNRVAEFFTGRVKRNLPLY